jgi:hypothetical protein
LRSIFSTGRPPATPAFSRGMIPMKVRPPAEARAGEFVPPVAKRRTAIYDMHHSVHCSIIGTCLSSAELRRLMIKLGVHGADTACDHDLHKQGVTLAGRAQGGGKLIQKALDRRHEAAIKQFAKAQDENGLRRLWDDAVKRGDIPGAYWAVLSHPAATDAIPRRPRLILRRRAPHLGRPRSCLRPVTQSARRPEARQHPLPNEEKFGAEVSLCPPMYELCPPDQSPLMPSQKRG